MRKRIHSESTSLHDAEPQTWLNLEQLAQIEITSEHPDHPIESALLPNLGRGWIARQTGTQTLRMLFDEPQELRHIRLKFAVEEARTQEFVLRWSTGQEQPKREILRQQFNFAGASQEVEDYEVRLERVKILEIEINPSISGGEFFVCLSELRLR